MVPGCKAGKDERLTSTPTIGSVRASMVPGCKAGKDEENLFVFLLLK